MSQDVRIIKRLKFDESLPANPEVVKQGNDMWPVVYLLNDRAIQQAYVGETTDLVARMSAHAKTPSKQILTEAHIIVSDQFNKSATLDIESNLIKYLAADGKYQLLNGNIGLANHNYYQKSNYWEVFKDIWNKLIAEGLAEHTLEYINNSDLFKYSPYKSLNRDQKQSIIFLLEELLNPQTKNIVMEGGAGTGKTVLAVFLFKLLNTPLEEFNFTDFGEEEERILSLTESLKTRLPQPRMALVVPMSSFRKTMKKIFRSIKGLKAEMVVGPSALTDKVYDIVVVDESHRLRRRTTLGSYYKSFDDASAKLGFDKDKHNELDWVQAQSNKAIFFYDQNQSIKPSDVLKDSFDGLKAQTDTVTCPLTSQFRVNGGRDYVQFVGSLLSGKMPPGITFKSQKYELKIFDSLPEMQKELARREEQFQLSRLVAGYSWPWTSKNDKSLTDIHIDDVSLKWNSVNEDWVNSANAQNEVGCIHTTQGYDLNYTGLIFGNEITYEEETKQIVINKSNYHDRNGKTGLQNEDQLKDYIVNIYKTLMLRGIRGTYIYICDEKLRNYFSRHIEVISSKPAPVQLPDSDDFRPTIPLYDLRAAAGLFSDGQHPEKLKSVILPDTIRFSDDLFACTVVGNSMNRIIPENSVCVFRRYNGGSRDGKIVLVELDDLQDRDSGSRYTVKEYRSTKVQTEEGWKHASIMLRPMSTLTAYSEIVLNGSEINKLKVIGIFEGII